MGAELDERDGWHDIRPSPDDPNGLRGRRVLVMGLGLLGGGVATARYAVTQGAAEVIVTDLRGPELLAPSIAKLEGLPIRYVLGRHDTADFEQADVIVRNPNVRRDSPYLAAALAAGRRVEMEIAWFFRACRGHIAGITGTRGKSTTTTLLHHILTVAGKRPYLGGNLGNIETLSLLPDITAGDWVVLELGNWMLEGLHTVRRSPHLAIFTNLLPDHLNAYDSMDDYGEAKSSIFRYQRHDDIALFNVDNAYTQRYGQQAPAGAVWYYSPDQRVAWLRDQPDVKHAFAYAGAIKLRGAHNLGNVQAATLAAEQIGIDGATIARAVASFAGVPHRLEVVRTIGGVTWVNDSASTAPVAGVAALRSFEELVVLIAGGNSKDLDASEYAAAAVARTRHIILLAGNASDAFAELLRAAAREQGHSPDQIEGPYNSLPHAIERARAVASPGDVVLLSPGFTSFGMFLNEFDRGDQFRALVRALPGDEPQP
ncbi:MAG TPA: UDP-N-acetylmuramoyl-L-alanine--D-glutamate ligase [Ktedonobacterales bacterium]|nr:UDP-N-acetylmuramoyl-L-alanine--D-glutamate ligase [Ktedonobacterales bacterium]